MVSINMQGSNTFATMNTLPTLIDTDRVRAYVLHAGQNLDGNTITVQGRIRGSWDASFVNLLGSRLVSVRSRRFLADHRTSVSWHANCRGATNYDHTRTTMVNVYLFVSPDESVMGRCFTVQGSSGPITLADDNDVSRVSVYATLVDSRLTTDRLADIVLEALGTGSGRAKFNDVESVRAQIHQAIANVVHAWPSDIPPRAPDLYAMVKEIGPHPVARIGDGAVSIAGGTMVIAHVDPRVARRCILEDSARRTIDMTASTTTTMSRACESVVAGIGVPPKQILLVAQQAGSEYMCAEEATGSVSRLIASGVPMAQIATIAHAIYEDAFGELGEPELLLALIDDDSMTRLEQIRCERTEAFATMVRILGQDKIIKRIKERVWRPGGMLVDRMIRKS
jgi:hypothetical protein